ncbi:MAG: PD40 domain-containing protein, partial [Bacteroidia bacterium]|nr:PD40 domain-containing protein [Bacteroidia bacterium]
MKKYILLILAAVALHSVSHAQSKADYRQKFTEGNYLILEGNYFQALKNFMEAYQIDSSSSNINYKVGLCYLNTVTEKSKALYYLEKAVLKTTTKYTDLEPREENAPVNAFYYYGKALHQNYKFDEAIANYEKFKSYLKASQKDMIADVDRQIEIANNAKALVSAPINVLIKNLGDSINTAYPDYSPVLSADEETMIFTSRRPGSTGGDKTIEDQFYEDIYISYKKTDSTWTTPVSVSSNVNTFTHEASVGLTADAQTLLIYKDANGGDIYYSTLDGENWTFPMAMGSDINTPSWETSACLSPDGNTLYYVSDRKEGSMGGRDIWKCVKLPNGKWSRSMNVGAPINTPFDE